MVERNFVREYGRALAENRIPYREPWIGFVHASFEFPEWWEPQKNPKHVCQLPAWRQSLPHCRGLIALSRRLRDCLRQLYPGLPVLALHHPTEVPAVTFDFEAYLRGGQEVVHIGWWLRRLCSMHWLPLPPERKTLLVPQVGDGEQRFWKAMESERAREFAPPLCQWNVTFRSRLSNAQYDALLGRSIAFLHLYASSANNAIIECIVRRTPVLVNPLPAVREYLGEDYPFYFESLEEAAAKASDPAKVLEAHRYLASKDVSFLSGEAFCRGLAESDLYRSL